MFPSRAGSEAARGVPSITTSPTRYQNRDILSWVTQAGYIRRIDDCYCSCQIVSCYIAGFTLFVIHVTWLDNYVPATQADTLTVSATPLIAHLRVTTGSQPSFSSLTTTPHNTWALTFIAACHPHYNVHERQNSARTRNARPLLNEEKYS